MTMLHEHVTWRTLGFVRFWVWAVWLYTLASDPIGDLAVLPRAELHAVGVLSWLPADWLNVVYIDGLLLGGKTVLLLFIAAAMIGVRPYQTIAVLAAIGLTFYQGIVRSYSYVDHNELVLLYAAYILAVCPANGAIGDWQRPPDYKPDDRSPAGSAALLALTLVMLATYAATGAYRFAHATPGIFTSNTVEAWCAARAHGHSTFGFTAGSVLLEHRWLIPVARVGFALTTLFEVLAPLCLISRWFRYAWLVVIGSMHAASLPMMNILFLENVLLFPVVMTDVGRWWPRVVRRVSRIAHRVSPRGLAE